MKRLEKLCPAWFPISLMKPLLLLFGMTMLVAVTIIPFRGRLALSEYLLWNMFLAGLPFIFACGVLWCESKKRRLLALPCWLLWIAFYPNAPYLLTDLIHLRNYNFSGTGTPFSTHPLTWFGFTHLLAGVIVGCCFGLISLLLLQRYVTKTHGKALGWLLAAGCSLLSGVGIWMGRCLRLNSWDIAHKPLQLLQAVTESFHRQALLLCLIFAAMSAGAYLLLRVFVPEELK